MLLVEHHYLFSNYINDMIYFVVEIIPGFVHVQQILSRIRPLGLVRAAATSRHRLIFSIGDVAGGGVVVATSDSTGNRLEGFSSLLFPFLVILACSILHIFFM